MKVRLPTKEWVSVVAGRVQWVCGEECGIETLVISDVEQTCLRKYIYQRLKVL